MKNIFANLSFGVLGCIIGFILGSLNSFRMTSFFYSSTVLEMAVDVYDLQQGKCDSVLERKSRALPMLVEQLEAVHRKFLSEGNWNATMWTVGRCYENHESGPPASIKHILDALGPRPLTSCEIERRAAAEAEPNSLTNIDEKQ